MRTEIIYPHRTGMQQSTRQNSLILKEVIESLSQSQPVDGESQQVGGRYPFHVSLSLSQPGEDGEPAVLGSGLGLDISYTGIAILSRKPIPTDTLLQVNLDNYLSRPWTLDVIVVDCMEVVDAMFRLGCVFTLEED